MARKLPWSASADTASLNPRPRPTKRQKTDATKSTQDTIKRFVKADASANGTDVDAPASRASRTSQRPSTRSRHGRSPSTSPPPGPPPVELMREGLDADDVYMMVEDEFHAVAQSYTAHLHHAEYKRLMREAKERNSANKLVMSQVPRGASFETKLRLKKAGLTQRQSTGLKEMVGPRLLDDSDEEDQDREVDEVEKKVVEPWAGTSLAGLMSWDASQRTSLKGLEKLKSETRAAQGFGPSATAIKTVKRETTDDGRRRNVSLSADQTALKNPETSMALSSSSAKLSNNSKNSLERESVKTTRVNQDKSLNSNTSTAQVKKEPPSPFAKTSSRNQGVKKPKSFIDALDDWDDDRFDMLQASTQTTLKKEESKPSDEYVGKVRIKKEARSPATKTKEESKKKDRSERYDEIPLFLI